MRWIRPIVAAALLGMVLGSSALAGKFNRVLNVGDLAPTWGELKSVEGRAIDLTDFAELKAVVVVFFANRCPMSQACTDRLNQIAADYKSKGVAVIAVCVSHAEADNFEAMQVRARLRKFQFEYAQDLSQEVARKYGATCTPHAFLLDGDRKIAYMGAIDDSPRDAAVVTETYLKNALDAVLMGQRPEIRETRQSGCDIEFVTPTP